MNVQQMDNWVNSHIDRFHMIVINEMEEQFGEKETEQYIKLLDQNGYRIAYVPGREMRKLQITMDSKISVDSQQIIHIESTSKITHI